MTTTKAETDDKSRTVRCNSCDFEKEARSQVHAKAIGRKHWNQKGHAVFVEVEE